MRHVPYLICQETEEDISFNKRIIIKRSETGFLQQRSARGNQNFTAKKQANGRNRLEICPNIDFYSKNYYFSRHTIFRFKKEQFLYQVGLRCNV